jgi:Asp-tRNA(Asn)/Glu-tRNA(Gln) amidotransferase A subunit family amidase
LKRAGVPIHSIDIAEMLGKLDEASGTVMAYEAARFHQERFRDFGATLADLATLVRDGLEISEERYQDATRYIGDCKSRMTEIFEATSIIIVPAATGPAPSGLGSTGDARMNAPWTALGTPAISIPMPVSDALPVGFQLTADRGEDARVLRAAVRVQGILNRQVEGRR